VTLHRMSSGFLIRGVEHDRLDLALAMEVIDAGRNFTSTPQVSVRQCDREHIRLACHIVTAAEPIMPAPTTRNFIEGLLPRADQNEDTNFSN